MDEFRPRWNEALDDWIQVMVRVMTEDNPDSNNYNDHVAWLATLANWRSPPPGAEFRKDVPSSLSDASFLHGWSRYTSHDCPEFAICDNQAVLYCQSCNVILDVVPSIHQDEHLRISYALGPISDDMLTMVLDRLRLLSRWDDLDIELAGLSMQQSDIVEYATRLDSAAGRRSGLCESPMEVAFYDAIACIEPIPILPQWIIGKYRTDFFIPHYSTIIEIDGHDYHASKPQRTADAIRQRALNRAGYHVIRFTGSEVYTNAARCAREAIETMEAMRKDSAP